MPDCYADESCSVLLLLRRSISSGDSRLATTPLDVRLNSDAGSLVSFSVLRSLPQLPIPSPSFPPPMPKAPTTSKLNLDVARTSISLEHDSSATTAPASAVPPHHSSFETHEDSGSASRLFRRSTDTFADETRSARAGSFLVGGGGGGSTTEFGRYGSFLAGGEDSAGASGAEAHPRAIHSGGGRKPNDVHLDGGNDPRRKSASALDGEDVSHPSSGSVLSTQSPNDEDGEDDDDNFDDLLGEEVDEEEDDGAGDDYDGADEEDDVDFESMENGENYDLGGGDDEEEEEAGEDEATGSNSDEDGNETAMVRPRVESARPSSVMDSNQARSAKGGGPTPLLVADANRRSRFPSGSAVPNESMDVDGASLVSTGSPSTPSDARYLTSKTAAGAVVVGGGGGGGAGLKRPLSAMARLEPGDPDAAASRRKRPNKELVRAQLKRRLDRGSSGNLALVGGAQAPEERREHGLLVTLEHRPQHGELGPQSLAQLSPSILHARPAPFERLVRVTFHAPPASDEGAKKLSVRIFVTHGSQGIPAGTRTVRAEIKYGASLVRVNVNELRLNVAPAPPLLNPPLPSAAAAKRSARLSYRGGSFTITNSADMPAVVRVRSSSGAIMFLEKPTSNKASTPGPSPPYAGATLAPPPNTNFGDAGASPLTFNAFLLTPSLVLGIDPRSRVDVTVLTSSKRAVLSDVRVVNLHNVEDAHVINVTAPAPEPHDVTYHSLFYRIFSVQGGPTSSLPPPTTPSLLTGVGS